MPRLLPDGRVFPSIKGVQMENTKALTMREHERAHEKEHDRVDAFCAMGSAFATVNRICAGESEVKNCWRCDETRPEPYGATVFIRRKKNGHYYLVFVDATGESYEFEIQFCPWCGRDLPGGI